MTTVLLTAILMVVVERFAAANAELGAAQSLRQCRIAQGTAGEGLHHIRVARRPLGLDPARAYLVRAWETPCVPH